MGQTYLRLFAFQWIYLLLSDTFCPSGKSSSEVWHLTPSLVMRQLALNMELIVQLLLLVFIFPYTGFIPEGR